MTDLSAFDVTGNNNAAKQVSVTRWNSFLDALEAAIDAVDGEGSFQPVDSDLTAIAALTTTAFGRSLLTLADAAALAAAHDHDADYQPLDADLTTLAANITAFGHDLVDSANAAAGRTVLGLGTSTTMDLPLAFNFSDSGEARFYADVAMTLTEQATSGDGTITYEKSTNAAPTVFNSTTSPVALEAGAWLKVIASAVTDIVAVHLKRTA